MCKVDYQRNILEINLTYIEEIFCYDFLFTFQAVNVKCNISILYKSF